MSDIEHSGFTPLHEVVGLQDAVVNHSCTMTGPCHRVMCVIVADKKVRPSEVYKCRILTSFQGHWIQDCPTNSDREFDNKPRIKRTTGIPRSFLKAVESPSAGPPAGVMVTPEGGYVVAQPDA